MPARPPRPPPLARRRSPAVDAARLRAALGRFPAGVALVTATAAARRSGSS